MRHFLKKSLISSALLVPALTLCSLTAGAQSINYDNLSFVEEPLAIDLWGGATLDVSGLADQSLTYDLEEGDDLYNTRINTLTRLQTQLPNSWHVSVQYFSSFDRLRDQKYTDTYALSVSDEWGTISAGNVTQAVSETVRRQRGVGNADIKLDDFLGSLDDEGIFYSIRNNAYLLALSADQEGRAEAALSFARPIGQSLYRLGGRVRKGDSGQNFLNHPIPMTEGDSYGATMVGSYAYSNWLVDMQAGYESIDDRLQGESDRVFGSVGSQIKLHSLSLSAAGHLGDGDLGLEKSGALGARYDLARGISLNGGYNYTDTEHSDSAQNVLVSVRYDF